MGLLNWFEDIFAKKADEGSLTGEIDDAGFVSKDLFYKILDLDSSTVLFFTKKNGWIGANKTFFEIFEFKNIDDFRGTHESIRELFEEEAEEVFTEYDKSWLDYIRSHKPDGYGILIKNKQGENRTFLAKSKMIKQQGTELYILELEDVTDLELARKQTEEVERLKSKFLANIGHEFRTPMNGILGFINLLEKSDPTEKQSEYLQMIHSSANSLMANIESLLDLAQMQSGRLKVSNSEFNPITEMEELVKHYSVAAGDKGIKLSFLVDPKLPAFVDGDLRKIKQVLNNLFNNALKFTKSGGKINLEVKLVKRASSTRCTIGFSVKDSGKGIPEDQLALITQPFVAGDQADERLGVGLSLCHGLVQMLGGKLKIHSEEGVGSTFAFALDFDTTPEHSIRMVEGRRAKVLLVDEKWIDDANLLTTYLRSFGLDVTKVHMIDDTILSDTDMLYIVGGQDETGWMLKLGNVSKQGEIVLMLDQDEKLQTRMTHLVDSTLNKPLIPSQISHHLTQFFKLAKSETKMEEIKAEPISALVAEDNLINQRLIKILLQEYSIDVVTAINGLEAVQLCETNDFDIVFMDIDMPVKNGILATQEIKEQQHPGSIRHMPIVALTALAMDGDREHILEEGLDDYLSKPLTREKLEHVLHKHLKIKL
ncbi:MAG: response regulator [Campylobacterota bacterium]|nr:response regulator [Campylobacterota bacterium]